MLSEKDYHVLSDLALDAIFILDENRLILECNNIAHLQLGYAKADMLGRAIDEFIPPEHLSMTRGNFTQDKDYPVHQSALLRRDGSALPVEICINTIALNGQQAIFAVFRDISSRKLPFTPLLNEDLCMPKLSDASNSELTDALKKIARSYRDIMEQAGDAITVADHEGLRYLEVNQAACDLLGYTHEEFLKLGLKDFCHPDDLPNFHGRLKQLWNGHTIHAERQLRRKNGSFVTVDVTTKMLEDGRLISIKRNITDRKIAESAMKRHQAILKATRDGFWLTDMKGNLLEVNQAYADMSGYTIEELLNMHISEIDACDNRNDVKARINKISSDGDAVFETRHRRKDGSLFDVEVSVNHLPEQQQFVSFFRDITTRKKNREKLEASLEFSNNMIQSMQDGFSILDSNAISMDANPSFCRMTGYSREELIGTTPPFPYWPPEEYKNIDAVLQRALKGETSDFELTFMRKDGQRFPVIVSPSVVKDRNGNILSYIATVKDISERKLAEKKIERLAYHDQLTGLPNRALLLDRLKQAQVTSERHGWIGALLFIDIDNFKNLNDTLGHDTGDQLLKEVANRLESCVREGDTVARLGGDEFVVMLLELDEEEMEAAAQTESIGDKILALLRQPYQLGSHLYHCTASIGITLFHKSLQTMEELMKQADITMYQSKKAGRNTLRFFDRRMQESINARMRMENELRRALSENQFELHYQIQINSAHQALGGEALIRWNHPERGMIYPEQFIPLTEETGLILPIGQWVLEAACAQLGKWQQQQLTKNLTLSVNVSARQFREPDFVSQIQAMMARHAINPMKLKLELTESLLQEDIDETISTMNALNELGVRFSLDDFGTGYSSLQYLKRLPLEQIKIDRSFVHDIATNASDKAIVYTIIAMAQGLNLNVIAEGVEVEEQRELLLNRSCTNYQGYLFGKPVPIEQFEMLLQ